VSDNNMTLAEFRHPTMVATATRIRLDIPYLAVMAEFDVVLDTLSECSPIHKARAAHDLINRVDDLSYLRGATLHDLAYDHAYEEIGALVGLTRQRVWSILLDWRRKFNQEDWPTIGRQSRIMARRQQDDP